MTWVQMLTFAAVVLIVAVLMTKYLIFSLVCAFPGLKQFRKLLNLLYVLNLAGFALFKERTFLNTKAAEIVSLVIYFYFTFLFVFVAYGIFCEILVFVRRFFKNLYEKHLSPGKRKIILAALLLIALDTVAAGWLLAQNVVIKNFEVKNQKIGQYTRVVQISDIHFSRVIDERFAEKIVPMINDLKPDLVLFTGDYMDKGIENPEKIAEIMNKIEAPMGKFAISGNHEFITGYLDCIDFIEKNGFEFMDGRVENIGRNIVIGGVMDRSAESSNVYYHEDSKVLNQFQSGNFNIYLKHRPELDEGDSAHFDLMLSGHTHGGQIFPFTILVKIFNRYLAGLYELEGGAKLYVSRGTGAWGPPVRFGATPEITLIELKP
ncbi:metallophosphoesterase [bacterium]|nr:metallophosphoesterase [bacterium]MBP5592499.1 metallophosphoesterase [bacterium]